MNRLLFQQVESLFEAAVGYDATEREHFLDRIAREHSREIRDLVARLLDCDRSQTRWTDFGSDAAHPIAPPAPEPAGTVLDRFRLIKRLGVGGHGEVYLADQLQPVKRQVALKMVRLGGATEQVIERFRAEQQALAVMNHPGVAAVYEAGLADQGRFFFAMEYVEGQPIDAFADQHRLTVRERLALFLKVTQAVQHAHQKGLIHRDIKPSNILVVERGGIAEPVLIDFGIAVATASALRNDAAGSGAIGTPAYMSPEQAGADSNDIDTRTDIYALGILLYELLVGRTPLDVLAPAGASLAEIRRCITQVPAPPPIQVLERDEPSATEIAARRGCAPRHLRQQVAGDLNAVVCRAIAARREDRYQTVEALAEDIHRHLQDHPVSVGSKTATARLRKFVRRHRLAVMAMCGLAAVVTTGVVGIALALLRAEHAARKSQAMNSFLTDLLTSSRPLEKGSTVPFVDVLRGGSDMAKDRFADHPQQEGEVRYVIGHTYYMLGLYDEARAELQQALPLLRGSVGMEHSTTLHTATLLAMSLASQNRLKEARALVDEIITHTAGKPMPWREHFLAADRLRYSIESDSGQYELAEAGLRALIPQIDAELGTDHLEAYNARMALVQALRRLTTRRYENEAPGAVAFQEEADLLRETVRLQEARFGEQDAFPLLSAQMKLGHVLLEQHRYAECAAVVQPILPRVRERFGEKHWIYCEGLIALATVNYAQGHHDQAADLFWEAVEIFRTLHPPEHPISLSVSRDALPYLDAADRVDLGLPNARDLWARLIDILGPEDLTTLEARGWVARFCTKAGLLDEAENHFAALEAYEEVFRVEAVGAYVSMFHAGYLARRGRFEQAEAELLRLAERQQGVATGVHRAHPDEMARMFMELYTAWGKPEKVEEYRGIIENIWSDTESMSRSPRDGLNGGH